MKSISPSSSSLLLVILFIFVSLSAFMLYANVANAHKVGWTGSQGQCENEALEWYTELMGYTKWNKGGANSDGRYSLQNLTSSFGVLPHYLDAIKVFAKQNVPLAAAFLPYARSFSLFDQMIDLPSEGNEPEDVSFDLPDIDTIEYESVQDLLYMPIR